MHVKSKILSYDIRCVIVQYVKHTSKNRAAKIFKLGITAFVDTDDIAWWLGTSRAQASIKLLI